MSTFETQPPLELLPPRKPALVAPIWHTVVLVLAVLGVSLLQAHRGQNLDNAIQLKSRLTLYFTQIAFELFIFCYVWLLGLKLTRTSVREIIGGRWATIRDLSRDLGVALIFWLVVGVVLIVLNKILGESSGLRALQPLLPQGSAEIAVWVCLCAVAGFCEEFIFRGYLQRQFLALTGSHQWAIILQALVFGAAHGYQGLRGMITIAIYGALFGILALRQKSLRPGMMQHAAQDTFSGIVGSILARKHYI
jgi:membrane protease YdiL (CAAX protease family)